MNPTLPLRNSLAPTDQRFFNGIVQVAFVLLSFLAAGHKAEAQTIFSQDFNSSTTVSSYVSATPNATQFNDISSSGAGTVVSINASNRLQFARTGNAGSFTRTTDFSPVPSAIIFKFDLWQSGVTTAQTQAAVFQVGSGFTTGSSAESNANTYARIMIDTRTQGSGTRFRLNDITNGGTLTGDINSGTTITWVMNNSGATLSYVDPTGAVSTVANDRVDLWFGTTSFLNDVNVQTATQTITDFKFVVSAGTETFEIDNINISVFYPVVTTQPVATQSVCEGTSVSFSAAATNGSPTVKWQKDISGTWTDIVGATSTTYTIASPTVSSAGSYRALFTNSNGSTPSSTAVLNVSATSVGGSVAGSASFCSTANSGTLTLSGHTGSVTRWESSINGGTSWSPIANTTTSLSYSNVATTTLYRAVVTSGACPAQNSSNATITITPTLGGSITGSASFCSPVNNGTLTLSGNSGSVVRWEFSTDAGASWSPIANTSSTLNYSNVAVTTLYRAVSQNGSCPESNSATATVAVNAPTVAGTIGSDATVCSGTNIGALTLTGYTGAINKWQSSTNGGGTWTDIVNTTDIQPYFGLTTTTQYRAIVQNATCSPETTSVVTITVVNPVVYNVTGGGAACANAGGVAVGLSGTETGYTYQLQLNGTNTGSPVSGTGSAIGFGNQTIAGTYTVVATNNTYGCTASMNGSALVAINAIPTVSASAVPALICPSGSSSLSGNASIPPAVVSGTTTPPSPVTITNNNATGITSTISVSGLPVSMASLTNIQVNFTIAHLNTAEVEVYLVRPGGALPSITANGTFMNTITAGQSICLVADRGGNGDNFTNAAFSSTATVPLTSAAAPFTGGPYIPENLFSTLTGNPNGTWTLKVLDDGGGTVGTFVTWTISFTFANSLTYSWSSSPSGFSTTDQNPGSVSPTVNTVYTVTVTEANNGCTQTASTSVSINPPISGSISKTDVLCRGLATGSATVTPSGGNGTYASYLWSNGQTTATATGLAAGNYSVTITDGAGCTGSASVTITEPASVLSAGSSLATPILCNGGSATVTVTASGGVAPYTGEGTFSASAGLNSFTVSDANGCSATTSITVSEPAALVASCVATDISCFGLTDGQVVVSAMGGTGAISGTGTFGSLAAGTYSYTVTDANGCTASCSATIAEPALLVASCSAADALCFGGNGSVTVSATGGTTPYSGTGTFALPAGTYNYTVTDANGCTSSCSSIVGEPTQLVASCTATDATCFGGNGSVAVTAVGGTGAIAGTGTFQVVAGTYNYTVTDANGCTASCSATVGQPAELVLTCTVLNHVACNGGNDGSFSVAATGGTGPYSGTGIYAGAVAGTNPITVTDANGCTANCSVVITEPAVLVASCTASDALCVGGNGSVTVSAVGGTTPYIGDGIFAVPAGTYNYTVTDANGCTSSCSATVNDGPPPTYNATAESACDSYDWSVSGQTYTTSGAYTFQTGACSYEVLNLTITPTTYNATSASACDSYDWSVSGQTYTTSGAYTFQTGACSYEVLNLTITPTTYNASSALGCGSYTWTVNNVTYSASGAYTHQTGACSYEVLNLTISSGLTANCSATDALCFGGNGSIAVSATGGVGPYSGEGTFSLPAGTYNYTVSDAAGCTASCSAQVNEPALLVASCTPDNESFPGSMDGSVTVAATGGNGSYTGTGLFGGLTAGTYNYTVTDGNGCTASCSATVGVDCITSVAPTSITASAPSICLGGSVTLSVAGGSLGYNANWVWYEGGCGTGSPIGTGPSVTVTPTGFGTISYFVRAEGFCNVTSCASASVDVISAAQLPPVSILSGPDAGCVGNTAVITAAAVPGATGYNWTVGPGVLINGQPSPYTSTSTTVTLTFTALPSGGNSGWNICVQATNGCGVSPNTKCLWIRATLSSPNAISGSLTACPSTSGNYTISALAGAASYIWSSSSPGVSISGTGTTATVNFGPSFSGGTICVAGVTSCGYVGPTRCLSISAAPGIPGAINGAGTICPGGSSSYSIAPVPGAVSYIWSTTGTGLSVIGSGTSATVSTTGSFVSGSVCVIAVGACGSPISNSPQRCKSIASGKVNTPGNITGDPRTGVCGQTYTYSIPALAGATSYTWTLPAGATGSSSTNSITVTFNSGFTSGQICVNGNNGCGAGFQRCVTVTGNPANPTGLTTTSTTPCIGTDILVSWNAVPGASSYDVLVPVGSTVLTGTPTTNTFAIINVGSTGGVVGIRARSSCGNSGTATLAITPVACRTSGTLSNDAQVSRLEVFPNPATDRVQLRFESPAHEQVTVEAYDAAGRRVKGFSFLSEEGQNLQEMDVTDLTPGLYFFLINGQQLGATRFTLVVE